MGDERETVTLASPDDAYSFRVGSPMVCLWGIEPEPGRWQLLRWRMGVRWRRWTRWFRPRSVVTKVDAELGVVTLGTERWSWRRWRWERIGG